MGRWQSPNISKVEIRFVTDGWSGSTKGKSAGGDKKQPRRTWWVFARRSASAVLFCQQCTWAGLSSLRSKLKAVGCWSYYELEEKSYHGGSQQAIVLCTAYMCTLFRACNLFINFERTPKNPWRMLFSGYLPGIIIPIQSCPWKSRAPTRQAMCNFLLALCLLSFLRRSISQCVYIWSFLNI